MRRLALIPFFMLLGTCGGTSSDANECAIPAEDHHICYNDNVYLCAAGKPEDVAANEAIDAACEASAGNDTAALAKCTLDAASSGKYKMEPMIFLESCAATGKTCDVFTDACVVKK